MRCDHNLREFIAHSDWYTFKLPEGYIPTESAPEKAREAMAAYNAYTYNRQKIVYDDYKLHN